MKKIVILVLLIQCSIFNAQCVKKEVVVLKKVISAYVDYMEDYRKIDRNNEILMASWVKESTYPDQSIGVTFISPEFLTDVKYKSVFEFRGYKLVLVSIDNENFENTFGKHFKKKEFEQINKGKNNEVNYDTRSIGISFNKDLKIVYVFPENKGLLKDIIDNELIISEDCPCLELR